MNRRDLDVLDLTPSVGPLVFDTEVRKLDSLIYDGQVMLLRPFTNLFSRSRWPSVAVRSIAVGCLEEPLILAFELVVEDDSMNARTLVVQAVRRAEVRAIELRVMRQLT